MLYNIKTRYEKQLMVMPIEPFNVEENNYITALKYLAMFFYWLIMLVTLTTPISSLHVKDKDDIFTARDEDMIF